MNNNRIPISRHFVSPISLAFGAALTLVSLSTRANEVIVPLAFGMGFTSAATISTAGVALLVILLIEAAVLRRMLGWPWRESLIRSFFANLFSTLIGFGVIITATSGEVFLIGCLLGAIFLMRLIPRLHKGSGRFEWLRRHLWLGGIVTAALLVGLGVSAAIIQDTGGVSLRNLLLGGFSSLLLLAAGLAISILSEAWVLYGRHPDAGVKLLRATVWMNIVSYGVLVCALGLSTLTPYSYFKLMGSSGPRERNAQKRTMGDMKTLAAAIDTYHFDANEYPAATNMDELCKVLVPDYIATCIRHDGWSSRLKPREFTYFTWEETSADCLGLRPPDSPPPNPKDDRCGPRRDYILASAGKDGVFEQQDMRAYKPRDTCTYNNDIIIRNGEFIQSPHGRQHDKPDNHLRGFCGPGARELSE